MIKIFTDEHKFVECLLSLNSKYVLFADSSMYSDFFRHNLKSSDGKLADRKIVRTTRIDEHSFIEDNIDNYAFIRVSYYMGPNTFNIISEDMKNNLDKTFIFYIDPQPAFEDKHYRSFIESLKNT
jgi:hypothetical protein